jgi:hypothetical protein
VEKGKGSSRQKPLLIKKFTIVQLELNKRPLNKYLSGRKKKGGVYVSWLTTHGVIVITYRNSMSFCSPDQEYLTIICRPYYFPREISLVIFIAVYILPQTDTTTVLK